MQQETKISAFEKKGRAIGREKWQDSKKGKEKNHEFAKARKATTQQLLLLLRAPGLRGQSSYSWPNTGSVLRPGEGERKQPGNRQAKPSSDSPQLLRLIQIWVAMTTSFSQHPTTSFHQLGP